MSSGRSTRYSLYITAPASSSISSRIFTHSLRDLTTAPALTPPQSQQWHSTSPYRFALRRRSSCSLTWSCSHMVCTAADCQVPLRHSPQVSSTIVCTQRPSVDSDIVAHWWDGYRHSYSPSQVNFLLFTCAWTILALAYLIVAPARFPVAAHKYGILAVEFLTMIFWFAGFIALAVLVDEYWCIGRVCDCAKAGAAFGAFLW